MTEPFVLDPEQELDAQRIAFNASNAALDASSMSAGKTAVAIRVAQLRGARQIVIVGPLQTRSGWDYHSKVVQDPATGQLGLNLPFHWINSTKTGQHAKVALQFGSPGIYFVGHAYAAGLGFVKAGHREYRKQDGSMGKKVIRKKTKFWESLHPDLLIVDEIHIGSTSTQTQTHKALMQMQAKFTLGLSGTPAGNRFEGIYPVSRVLWKDLITKSPTEWKRQWCKTVYDPFAYDHMKVIGELNPGAFFAWLPCVVRREWKYEGMVDSDQVYVELSPQQRKAYRELEETMVTWLDGVPFTIQFPPALRIRLRQATLGMFHVTEDGSIDFAENCKSTKLDALHDIFKHDFEGEPALAITDSKRFAKVVVARTPGAELWSGDQSPTVRDEIKARFQSGETKYVVMVIKAGGTGTDGLQFAARNLVEISPDDSRIDNEQVYARIIRRGQGDLVRVRRIIALDTYDQQILHGHLQKAVAMRSSLQLDK